MKKFPKDAKGKGRTSKVQEREDTASTSRGKGSSNKRGRSSSCHDSAVEKRKRDSSPNKKQGTYLETFLTHVVIEGKQTLVCGVLDGCSNVSYIHNDVLGDLRIRPCDTRVISIQGIGSEDFLPMNSSKVNVTFLRNNNVKICCSLYSTSCLVGNSSLTPPSEVSSSILPASYNYADPNIFGNHPRPIRVLIGNDYRNLFVRLNRDKVLTEGLLLRPNICGWIPTGTATSSETSLCFHTLAASNNSSLDNIKSEFLRSPNISLLWELEVLGIRGAESDSSESAIIEKFRCTTRFENGRYVVTLPRCAEVLNLPTHYRMCAARLKSLLQNLDRDTLVEYDHTISEQLAKGIVEYAPRDSPYEIHYVPHFPKFQDGKKTRIVYDGSAKLKSGRSLNSMLYTGPSLTGNLVRILLNFRLKAIGITADIEKAFHMVGLDAADRDLVHFLWVKDFNDPSSEIITLRFARTPFGLAPSPFLLSMVLQEHLSEGKNQWFEFARQHFYVDNFVASLSSTIDAVHLAESLTDHLALAGFNLRDWTSNSEEFVNALSSENRMVIRDDISILGLQWNRPLDHLSITFKDEEDTSTVTLCAALSALHAVFDPLGLCGPCVLPLKLFIQQCWKIKANWDEPLPSTMEGEYRKRGN